ncbi:hypothetical protein EYF80_041317 [Liparis tanakae]|uniref:Uncharacterized protein n=1 Tax=Liparis tanakae TaxID=230148 RepID=A0A4Z2G4I0_9TELE|nr:hypothetical protein EYF80_041317 [Liparis tanakae]
MFTEAVDLVETGTEDKGSKDTGFPHAGSNHLKRCGCAYITVANPGVRVLPRAEGVRQGVVGPLLLLLGSRRLAAGMRLLLVLTLVG